MTLTSLQLNCDISALVLPQTMLVLSVFEIEYIKYHIFELWVKHFMITPVMLLKKVRLIQV